MELNVPSGSVLSFNCHGTLVPLPETHRREVRAGPEVARLIDALAEHHRVLITSRRTVAQVREAIGAERPRYIGMLGLQTADGLHGDVWTNLTAGTRAQDLELFWREVGPWPSVKDVTAKVVRGEVTIEIHLGEVPPRDVQEVCREIEAAALHHGITVNAAGGEVHIRPSGLDIGRPLTSEVVRLRPKVAMHVGDDVDDVVGHNALRRMVADELLPRAITVGVRSATTPAEILRCAEETDPRVQGFLVDGGEGVIELLRQLTDPDAVSPSM